MKTKIDIVSGFLGAGKTTIIRKLILEEYKDEKVVVLENEFGKVNIDGQLLKNNGVLVKEMTSGCICCDLSGNFDEAIIEILKSFSPDRIIVEPTGIAMLSQVINGCISNKCSDLVELNMVITVVDVKRFKLSHSFSKVFLENQIKATQSVILSKTDEVEEEVIQEVIYNIYEINKDTIIINLPWDKVTAAELISAVKYKPKEKSLDENKTSKLISAKRRPRIEACEIETELKFSKERLKVIFSKLANAVDYGNIIRGKGVVLEDEPTGLKFDYVLGDLTFETFNLEGPSKICIIGMNLNKNKIRELFI